MATRGAPGQTLAQFIWSPKGASSSRPGHLRANSGRDVVSPAQPCRALGGRLEGAVDPVAGFLDRAVTQSEHGDRQRDHDHRGAHRVGEHRQALFVAVEILLQAAVVRLHANTQEHYAQHLSELPDTS